MVYPIEELKCLDKVRKLLLHKSINRGGNYKRIFQHILMLMCVLYVLVFVLFFNFLVFCSFVLCRCFALVVCAR